MHASILLGLLPALALATPAFPIRRADELAAQDCTEVDGYKACGTNCIESTWTCCEDLSGGCPAGSYCAVGDNNKTGCCPDGHVCGGDGGVSTTIITLSTSDDVTSTTVVDATSTEEASVTVTEESTTASPTPVEGPTLIDTSAREDPTATSSATEPPATPSPSATESASASASESAPAGYTTSTIYSTTIHTITSCPATHPCTAGASTPVILVTETIAVSTTICPVVESPPLPTPTGLPTTTASPVPKPSIVCPGQGKNCFSASTGVVAPTKATGTGAYHPPSPTGKVVTAGAGKATFGLAAVVAAFAVLL